MKLSEFIQNISSFVVGLFIALLCGWKLTAVALCMLPFVIIGFGSFGGLTRHFTRKESLAYAKAGAIAEEVFRSIRTVYAFAGEQKEAKRYGNHLNEAAKVGVRQATCFGFGELLIVVFPLCLESKNRLDTYELMKLFVMKY